MRRKKPRRARIRGRRGPGRGARKKRRGRPRGKAGFGKRAATRKTLLLKQKKRLGKIGFKPIKKVVIPTISLGEITARLEEFLSKGIARKTKEGITLNLPTHKVLSTGEPPERLLLKVRSISEKAKRKVEAGGGKVL